MRLEKTKQMSVCVQYSHDSKINRTLSGFIELHELNAQEMCDYLIFYF